MSVRISKIYSEKMRATRKRQMRVRGFFVGFIIILLMGGAIGFFLAPFLLVRTVDVSSNTSIRTEDIQQAVFSSISGYYFYVVPRNHIAVVSRHRIERVIQEKFPRIAEVNVSRNSFHVLSLDIKERAQKYIWCSDPNFDVSGMTVDSCFFVDEKGYLFAKAPYFSGPVFLKFYGGQVNRDAPLGTKIFSDENDFKHIIDIIDVFAADGTEIASVMPGEAGRFDCTLVSLLGVKVSPQAKIIFDGSGDAASIAERVRLAAKADSFQERFNRTPHEFLYLDIRLANKIYFKFSDGSVPSLPSETVPPADTTHE